MLVLGRIAGLSSRVAGASDCGVRGPGSNHTANDCVYRDSRCGIQPWARATQCLGRLSLPPSVGR